MAAEHDDLRPDLALVAEACRRSALLWLALPGQPQARAVWHVWWQDAAYLVCGGGEQELPGIVEAGTVAVTVRSKDKGSRLVTWTARVVPVEPGSPHWDDAVRELVGNRLNLPDGERAPERWAREARIVRLEPTGEVAERPGALPDGSLAAPPVPTAATTRGPLPFVLGRRAGRRRRGQRDARA